jgi:hypothetical protein
MSRGMWKVSGISVKRSPDFGPLTVRVRKDDTVYEGLGEYEVYFDGDSTPLRVAIVRLSEQTCTIYDMEKRTLLLKRALTISADDLQPRSVAYLIANEIRIRQEALPA